MGSTLDCLCITAIIRAVTDGVLVILLLVGFGWGAKLIINDIRGRSNG